MLTLQTLGRLDLSGPEGTDAHAVLSQPKPLATLVYLAVAGGRDAFHRRDALLGLLWAETTTAKGRRALSQALHVLRNALGSDLFESRGIDEIRITPGALACDAAAFREAALAGRSEEAMQLYTGELLPSFMVSEAGSFEDWVASERNALRDLAANASWKEAARFSELGENAEAVVWAGRACAFTPYDENAARRLMGMLDRAGDSAGAVVVYNELAARLDRDLSVKPSKETRTFVAAIRARVPTPQPMQRDALRGEVGKVESGESANGRIGEWATSPFPRFFDSPIHLLLLWREFLDTAQIGISFRGLPDPALALLAFAQRAQRFTNFD